MLTTSTIAYEGFFPDGDIYFNHYFDALGYSIRELPFNGECPNCIEYDEGLVVGSGTDGVIENTGLFDVAERYGGYGLRRIPNVLDRVALPPNSTVDFVYWGFNDTQEDVYVDSIKVFLSRYYQYQGDISKVLNISGTYEEIKLYWLGLFYSRVGLVKTYPGIGMVNYTGQPLNPIILDSVSVKSPLVFRDWKYVESDGEAKMEITVENISESELENVLFRHMTYEYTYSFEPLEKHTFEYSIQPVNDELGLASIFNPNIREECVVYPQFPQSDIVGDSTPLVGTRSMESVSKFYLGSRVLSMDLSGSFCVKRIPYKLYSGEMIIRDDEEVTEEDDGNTAPEIENKVFDTPGVKGVSKLPQTSKEGFNFFEYILVVGGIFLWYYLYRRLKHEN